MSKVAYAVHTASLLFCRGQRSDASVFSIVVNLPFLVHFPRGYAWQQVSSIRFLGHVVPVGLIVKIPLILSKLFAVLPVSGI